MVRGIVKMTHLSRFSKIMCTYIVLNIRERLLRKIVQAMTSSDSVLSRILIAHVS